MIKWQLRFTITEFHLILVFIFGIHMSLLGMTSKHTKSMADIQKEEKEKGEAKKLKAQDEGNTQELVAGQKLVRKPFIITYVGNLKQRRYSDLMSLLGSKFSKNGPKVVGKLDSVLVSRIGDVEMSQDHDFDFKLTESQKKNLLKRLVREKLSGVEVCKRKHLLEDEFLFGTLKVHMKILTRDNHAIPKFHGHGNKKVIESLENCVRSELAVLKFPHDVANEEVSFELKVN